MPDYKDIKDGLKKRKARKFKTLTFTNVQQVIVRDIMTSDAKELFLI